MDINSDNAIGNIVLLTLVYAADVLPVLFLAIFFEWTMMG
jgi:hypothetical protein